MFWIKPAPPDAIMEPKRYCFTVPTRLVIRSTDGVRTSVGFGIGDRIEVLEPGEQYCISSDERRTTIPLPDGSEIVEFPDDLDRRARFEYDPRHWAPDYPGG